MAPTLQKKHVQYRIILLSSVICIFILNIFPLKVAYVQAEPGVEWETLVGTPANFIWGTGVDQTTEGGYVVVGYIDTTGTGGSGFYKVYLAKMSSEGRKEWSKGIGDSTETSGYFVQQTDDDGYIISGSIDNQGIGVPTGVYLLKTDSLGNTEWTKTYGSQLGNGNSVYQTTDGGYILSGGTNLIKTDSNGNQQWSKLYSDDVMYARQTSDEGYILVTGEQTIKLDVDGSIVWSYNLGVFARSICETSDGGCIVIGGSMALFKIDSSGNLEWTRSYGSGDTNTGYSVQETYDGGYIVAGTTRTDNNVDVYVVRTDENGSQLWEKNIGTTGTGRGDYGYHVELCDDGGYIVVGASDKELLNGVSDVYLIKISPDTTPPLDPAEFIVYDLIISPDEVEIDQDVEISVTIENIGDETGSHAVDFRINDIVVYNQSVTLDGGEYTVVTYVTSFEINGTYSVSVDGLSDTFRVRGPGEPYIPPEPEPEPAPIPEPEPEPETQKTPTNIGLQITDDTLSSSTGFSTTFRGFINPPIFGATIKISFFDQLRVSEKEDIYVTTALDGSFSGDLEFPSNDSFWEIRASFTGNEEYEGSSSAKQFVSVNQGRNLTEIPAFSMTSIIISIVVIIVLKYQTKNSILNR